MIEIPESVTLGKQAASTLVGRRISKIYPSNSPHKFAWFSAPFEAYQEMLTGAEFIETRAHGMFVDLLLGNDAALTIGEGTNMHYLNADAKLPDKYQLLLELDDHCKVVFTVAMYGGMWAWREGMNSEYHTNSLISTSPLSDAFDEEYFDSLLRTAPDKLCAKGLLATKQRIPGLGNGCLQDILFVANINPRRKVRTLSEHETSTLYKSIKNTLAEMTRLGGRNTEKDLFGNKGGYNTLLCSGTYKKPCVKCKATLIKEAYLGGSVYYCPECQKNSGD